MAHKTSNPELEKVYGNYQPNQKPSQINHSPIPDQYSKSLNLEKQNLMTTLRDSKEELYMSNFNEINKMEFSDDKELDFNHFIDDGEEDFDYLDALVERDYRRLNSLPTDKGAISSIFSEIIENEQQSNTNYKDEVFSKNIELIFNSEIDLDNSEWDPTIEFSKIQAITQITQDSLSPNETSLHDQDTFNEESNHEELLKNLEKVISKNLFQKLTPATNELNSRNEEGYFSDSIARAKEVTQEKVMIRKIVEKKRENAEFNIRLITLVLLTALVIIFLTMFIRIVIL